MLRQFVVASVLLTLGLAPIVATAQQSPVPERRVLSTTGQDFYGADIGSIFETTFQTCWQACRDTAACEALTFNTKANACFLKSGIERREPFADAVSAEMIVTPAETVALATQRRTELDFVTDEMIQTARTLAAGLGGKTAANSLDPDALLRTAAAAEQNRQFETAARNVAAAATISDGADAWRELARIWGHQAAAEGGDQQLEADALAAAINAYLRSSDDPARAASLSTLAEAMQDRGLGRGMIDALRLAQAIEPTAETNERLTYAISRYGFRVTDHRVDSDTATARICVVFSESLSETGVDYAPYLRLDGGENLPVEAKGNQLCVDGATRGKHYALSIRQGLPSAAGETLHASTRIEAYVRDRAPSVRFVGRSYVLPRSADAAIPVVTVNLREVSLAIHRIGERNLLPAIQQKLVDQALAGYREDALREQWGAPVWTGTADVTGDVNADVLTALPIGEAITTFEPGIYAMTARGPGDDDRWERAATQWFIVTDLGLASMNGTDGLHGFVRSLSSAEPIEGVDVALVAQNNEILARAKTDAQGYVRFDAGLTRGRGGASPAILTVETSDDFAFIDLTTPGFDLSDRGVEGRAAPGPIDVFASTERGVYRPGETVHLTALARDGRADAIRGLPLIAVFTRPDGVEYRRAVLADEGAGGRSYALRLGGGVPRGTWSVKLHTDPEGPPVRQLSFLVEDFTPERIDVELDAPEGAVLPNAPLNVAVSARYLYGAPGADLQVSGEIRVADAKALPGFAGFHFGLESERVGSLSEFTPEVATDANGDAVLSMRLPEVSGFTKPLEVTAIVGVTDSSGRPTERTLVRPLSPAHPQIGIRPLFDGQAEEGGTARFEVLALDRDGTQAALGDVGWTLSRINQEWQWYEIGGRWKYEPITTRARVADGRVALTKDQRAIVEGPVTWGRYELRLADLSGSPAATSLTFNAGWYTGGAATDTPDILEVGLDKDRYAIGETVRLRLKPRDAGKVQVAVLDDRLIEQRVLDVTPGETTVDLRVTEDWGPGAYITATLIRPMDVASKRNPARAMGLAWAKVDPGDRALDLSFTTPTEVAPRGPLHAEIQISNAPEQDQVFVTIAAVDVGILNLTGFTSPAPEAHYFGQRALGMELRDVYGRLIDGMQGVRGRLRSGGDGASSRTNAPPPTEELVAYFSGIVAVGPDGTAKATFELPDFNGTVRLMAVAWSDHTVGHATQDVLVRDPIVVAAAVPRFLAPGDETRMLLELTHAMGPEGDVEVSVEAPGGGVGIADGTSQIVTLGDGETQRISIPLVATEIGDHSVLIRLRTPSGDELTKNLTLPIRLNDPAVSRQTRLSLAPGGRIVVDRQTFAGLEGGTARASLALGPVAAFDAPGLLVALDRYPYGCTEQVTSRAMPLLYLDAVATAAGITSESPVDDRVQEAIARVLENQSSAGAFGLWRPDRGDLWLDAYVTDFLSRAKALGHPVPETAFDSALGNLSSALSYASDFDHGGEDIAYALMVLAREGRASIGDLRYYADAKATALATPMAKAQLGAALAFYGEQQRADALFALAQEQVLDDAPEIRGWRLDYGSRLRDGAAVLALAAEARSTAVNAPRLVQALTSTERPWTSTQEKVWMLLATKALADQAAESLAIDSVAVEGPAVRVFEDDLAAPVVIENRGGEKVQAVLTTFGVPIAPQPAGGTGYRVERSYFTLDGDPVSPETVAQNARLAVVLTVHSDLERTGRLMVDDPLPAGFEIDNPNLLRAGSIGSLDWLDVLTEVNTAQFRSDRFLAAVDHSGTGTFRLAYLIRAVSPGSFHHPAALVEDMYRPEYRAWTNAGRVTVVPSR